MYADQFMRRIFHAILVSVFFLGYCSLLYAADDEIDFLDDAFYEEDFKENIVNDPFEKVNRMIFTFNDYAFTWILNPVATGYSNLLPWDIRGAIANVFYNLQEPMRFVNSVLQ
ncbi:MAG: VacJ family lipoprotein, partial [Candidatus Electrothrix sp. EH2]|nr:VacJ family lipoprotein [Candidatus Electrothrix sp. EH2]